MLVATDKTLITMIEHKEVFFGLIDYLDQREQGEDIPLQRYYSAVRAILQQSDDREQRRLQQTFDPENLLKAGLLIELDKHRSTLVFQGFVVEMFRHFERSRLRELSSEQLEALRLDLNHSLERLADCRLVPGDATFEEVLSVLFERLRNALGRIKQNVASLQGQAEHLATIVEERDVSDLEQTRQAHLAMDEINRIYSRHVLPTLQFLNEREPLRTGLPALTAVGKIAELLESAQLPSLSQRVLFARNSIRSYAKDVEVIRKALARYVRQSARQRRQYDTVESAYNALRAAVHQLADGRLNTKYLQSRDAVFHAANVFSGLKRQRFEARLEWAGIRQRVLLEEHLRVALPRLRERRDGGTVALDTAGDSSRLLNERQVTRRKQRIQQLVTELVLPASHPDSHAWLHGVLMEVLPDYTLSDLLDGLAWLRSRPDVALTPAFVLKTLVHQGLCLDYFAMNQSTEFESIHQREATHD